MKRSQDGFGLVGVLLVIILIFLLASISWHLSAHQDGAYATSKPPHDLLFDSDRSGNFEIYQANTDGSVSQLTQDRAYDSFWPKPSPDGTSLVFQRSPRGSHDKDYTKTSLWGARIDGSSPHELIPNKGYGWAIQGHVEWAPDGRSLVIAGGLGNVYITNPNGTNPRQITGVANPLD
jgi:Tol biopolymer transport system component